MPRSGSLHEQPVLVKMQAQHLEKLIRVSALYVVCKAAELFHSESLPHLEWLHMCIEPYECGCVGHHIALQWRSASTRNINSTVPQSLFYDH